MLLTPCSEKNVPRRTRTDYSFLYFSCTSTSSKALECRRHKDKSREDGQCEGNGDICLADIDKVSVTRYSCIEIPVVSDIRANVSGVCTYGCVKV